MHYVRAAMWVWLPPDRHFTRAPGVLLPSPRAMLGHLSNPPLAGNLRRRLLRAMFTLIATFTYVNFYLAAPPFRLGTTALGLIFVVYLIGAVVTPVAGRAIDRHRAPVHTGGRLQWEAIGGISLTLVPHLAAVLAGLALTSTGVFIAQSAASSYVGRLAREFARRRRRPVRDVLLRRRQLRRSNPGHAFGTAAAGRPRWL
jgi:MFS transporter, YNFM family, putative membrane transport protein